MKIERIKLYLLVFIQQKRDSFVFDRVSIIYWTSFWLSNHGFYIHWRPYLRFLPVRYSDSFSQGNRWRPCYGRFEHPRDLGEISKEEIDSAFNNLRYPPKRMTYPDVRCVLPEYLVGILADVQPFKISGKSLMRLHAAWKVEKYYKMIHCDLTPANMSWSVFKVF